MVFVNLAHLKNQGCLSVGAGVVNTDGSQLENRHILILK